MGLSINVNNKQTSKETDTLANNLHPFSPLPSSFLYLYFFFTYICHNVIGGVHFCPKEETAARIKGVGILSVLEVQFLISPELCN